MEDTSNTAEGTAGTANDELFASPLMDGELYPLVIIPSLGPPRYSDQPRHVFTIRTDIGTTQNWTQYVEYCGNMGMCGD